MESLVPMPAPRNSLEVQIFKLLAGKAQGPIGIAAFVVVVLGVVALVRLL
jgi:uncharacterized integral membrane protein